MSRKRSPFKNGMHFENDFELLIHIYQNLLGDTNINKIHRGGQENKIDMVRINMHGSDCASLWVHL